MMHKINSLKNAVAALAKINAERASVLFSQKGFSIQVHVDDKPIAVLFLRPVGCDQFSCLACPSFTFDFPRFHDILTQAAPDEESVFITIRRKIMTIFFENPASELTRCFKMELTRCNVEVLNVVESKTRVKVGIPSVLFHKVLMDLRNAATAQPEAETEGNPVDVNKLSVLIRIKETQLIFYTIHKQFSLHKEAGEYEISSAGPVADNLHIIKLGLCHLNSYLNAAILSDQVWIEIREPSLLCCPFGGDLGILYFTGK